MKYIKEYNEYVDPFDEDDWDEVEPIRMKVHGKI